jgi:hypothetical protein
MRLFTDFRQLLDRDILTVQEHSFENIAFFIISASMKAFRRRGAGVVAQEQSTGPTVHLTEAELQQNRVFMTIAHFMLTYPRWSLSLFLLLASSSLSLPSAKEAARQPLLDLQHMARQESDLYLECTMHAFDALGRQLEKSVQKERNRVAKTRESNQKVVLQSTTTSDQCRTASITARRALQTYRNAAFLPTTVNDSTSVCTTEDREKLTSFLGQDYTLVEKDVTNLLDAYVSASRLGAQRISLYAQDRATYDYNYFVGLKIQTTLDLLNGYQVPILSLNNLAVLDDLRALLQAIIDALKDARSQIDLLSTRLLEFQASIQGFYVNYVDIYGRLILARDFVIDFLPAGVPLPSYLDLQAIPIGDILLPQIFSLPTFGDLPEIDDLVAEYLHRAVGFIAQLLSTVAEEANEQLADGLRDLIRLLDEALTLEDYDPPKYVGSGAGVESPDEELILLQGLGDALRDSILDTLRENQEFGQDLAPLETPSLPAVEISSPNFDDNNTRTFDYLTAEFPSILIPKLIMGFAAFLVANQWIIEIVIQFIRLWKLRRKYERDASPDLPTIDYATDEDDNSDGYSQSNKLALLQAALLKHFMTPWMALGLILFPFAMVGVLLWFPHVKRNCIDTQKGTFVARNIMTPLLVNRANLAGNGYHTRAEFQCRRTQRQLCDQLYAESDSNQRLDIFTLNTALHRYNQSMDANNVFDRCVQVSALDEVFENSCCGLDGYGSNCSLIQNETLCPIDSNTLPPTAFQPVGSFLSNGACSQNPLTWTLEDARFKCEALEETCQQTTCLGVDADLIEYLAIEADCQVEVYIIKCCILILLALYHAIIINLSCTLAFNGVKHLRWRSLRPSGIQLRTHVNANGELAKGQDREDRSKRIAIAMRRFEMLGYLQLILSGAFFFMWIVTFFVFRNKLAAFDAK